VLAELEPEDGPEDVCITEHREYAPLLTPGVLRTFFLFPKMNRKNKPVPEGPDGDLSPK